MVKYKGNAKPKGKQIPELIKMADAGKFGYIFKTLLLKKSVQFKAINFGIIISEIILIQNLNVKFQGYLCNIFSLIF